MPSISSSLDETVVQLDRLHQATRDREAATFAELRAVVARLDVVVPGDTDEVGGERHERQERSGRAPSPAPDPAPFVSLPQTRGNPWGASLRAKFIAEASEKGDW